jgi:LysM repeat protein
MSSYKDSSRYPDARRVLGELNVSGLFPSSKDAGAEFGVYTVKRGDSLQKIAVESKCPLEYIVYVNQLTTNVIHPGDRFVVRPMDFQVTIDLSDKLLTLTKEGHFLKEYAILRAPLPALVKPPLTDAVLAMTTAHLPTGKQIGLLKPGFAEAAKWLHVRRDRQKADAFLIVGGPAEGEGEIPKEESGIVLSVADIEELLLLLKKGTIIQLQR